MVIEQSGVQFGLKSHVISKSNERAVRVWFEITSMISYIITPILKSLVVPVIWLALVNAIYSRIAPFFALNRTFSRANEEATLKTKQPIRFQGLFKVGNLVLTTELKT